MKANGTSSSPTKIFREMPFLGLLGTQMKTGVGSEGEGGGEGEAREGLGLTPHRGLVIPLPSTAHVSQESSRHEALIEHLLCSQLVPGVMPSKDI